MRVTHADFGPVFDAQSRILILGSIPSPKSRENRFYYGHPQNRCWPVLAALFHEPLPSSNKEKEDFLHRNHIAMWDVLASCDIKGADDGSIANPEANDIGWLLRQCPIRAVFTAGNKATVLYRRYCLPQTGVEAVYLPSTSPTNRGRYPMERLLEEWAVLLPYLGR